MKEKMKRPILLLALTTDQRNSCWPKEFLLVVREETVRYVVSLLRLVTKRREIDGRQEDTAVSRRSLSLLMVRIFLVTKKSGNRKVEIGSGRINKIIWIKNAILYFPFNLFISFSFFYLRYSSLLKNCNHKGLGIYYLLSAFIFGISGTLISVLIRIELYSSGNRIISPENQNFYNISITLHGFLFWLKNLLPLSSSILSLS